MHGSVEDTLSPKIITKTRDFSLRMSSNNLDIMTDPEVDFKCKDHFCDIC